MFIKLCNLGRDAEVRYTPGGKAVASLALAYLIGFGDQKRTQSIEATLWGERAEKMASHLTKGTKLLLTADDLEVEVFDKRDGSTDAKLKARVVNLEFAGSRQNNQGQGQFNQLTPARQPHSQTVIGHANNNQAQQSQGAGSWDDDIPFMRLHPMQGG